MSTYTRQKDIGLADPELVPLPEARFLGWPVYVDISSVPAIPTYRKRCLKIAALAWRDVIAELVARQGERHLLG